MATARTKTDDRALLTMKPGKHPVVTCYLKIEPRDRVRKKYLTKVKNRVKALEYGLPSLGWEKAQQDAIKSDLKRIVEFLGDADKLPTSPGVAIFASKGQKIFEVRPLPKVYRSRLAVDRTPLVRELAATEEEFGKLFTVALDGSTAVIWEVTAWAATVVRKVETAVSRSRGRGGGPREEWASEHTYHNRIQNAKRQHLEAVARAVFEVDRKSPGHQIVVVSAGNDASALEPYLHSYVADRLIGVGRLALKDATAAAVHQLTMDVREAHERASEHRHIEELEEGLGTGWAVRGVKGTLKALGQGQVRLLLVDHSAAKPGFRSLATGRIALGAVDLKGDGEVVPTLDAIDDAIEEALRQRVALDVVHDDAAAEAVNGMSALLRFK